jgi:N4-gp56 family major capsid protein
MYTALPANVTPATEGAIGSGISVSTLYTDYTLGQWGDFVNFSQFLLLTTIDPMVENVEKELAYRCGRSIQKLTLAQADFARTIDATVGAQDATSGTQLMNRNTGTQAAGSMTGRDVKPLEGGNRFGCLIHPWLITDMMVDNTNNSFVDIMKHTPEGQMALKELPAGTGESEEANVISMGGITYLPTTQLTTTANYLTTGKTAIRTYMVGEDGLIAVRITNPDRTDIGDGDHRNLQLWRGKYAQGTAFDPTGQIGGGTSYLVTGTWGLPPDPIQRLRAYDFVPQNT